MGAEHGGIGKHLVESFAKPNRLMLALSSSRSNQALKFGLSDVL